jgi:hypothetical protein
LQDILDVRGRYIPMQIGQYERTECPVGVFQRLRVTPIQTFADIRECSLHAW